MRARLGLIPAIGTLLLLICLPLQAKLTAEVDRSELQLGQTVELLITASPAKALVEPNWMALQVNFELASLPRVGYRASSSGQDSRQWLITLRPKVSGIVVIPPLRVGNERSQPISLRVTKASAPTTPAGYSGEPVFIVRELLQPKVSVQQQSIIRVRLYHSVPLLQDSELSSLQVEGALIYPLDNPKQYEERINGVRHGVFELHYVLYPQRSGPLEIGPQTFSGTIGLNGSRRYRRAGQQVSVQSPPLTLEVTPQANGYPATATWLPANDLQLSEEWSQSVEQISVGDTLTRTLRLEASGLSGAQLPMLDIPSIEGVKIYADQPQSENQLSPSGIRSHSIQAHALIAIEPGRAELPAIQVPWFNTRTQQIEIAELPARTLQITGTAPVDTPEPQALPPSPPESKTSHFWIGLCALLATCSGLLGYYSLYLRKQLLQQTTPLNPQSHSDLSERQAMQRLRKACQQQKLADIPATFCDWHQQLTGMKARGLLKQATATQDPELLTLAIEIDQALYSEEKSPAKIDLALFARRCRQWQQHYLKNHKNKVDQTGLYPK